MCAPFNAWLISIETLALKPIKLESLTTFGANNLISEALQISPRLTLPLSYVLHHKTRGNPLFLRQQLLDSLTEQGYIFMDTKQHRWAWDLDRVIELDISDGVITLLMSNIQRLPSDLQFGLQVTACIDIYITESMLNYLSIDLGLDL
jgi:predicted ATPase